MATSMGERFEQLSDLLLPTVLRLTTRANKVYVSSATSTLKACIKAAGLISLIPTLLEGLQNPSKSMRIASIEAILLIVEKNGPHRLQGSVALIEKAIKDGVLDPTHEVRDCAKTLFENYKVGFGESLAR
jgi:CLASP N terminal